MGDRPLRFCDVCGGFDDHPRHVQAFPPGTPGTVPSDGFLDSLVIDPENFSASARAIADLMRPDTLSRHMDCCAAQGCPTCQATEQAAGGVRGQKLIDSIASGVLDGLEV